MMAVRKYFVMFFLQLAWHLWMVPKEMSEASLDQGMPLDEEQMFLDMEQSVHEQWTITEWSTPEEQNDTSRGFSLLWWLLTIVDVLFVLYGVIGRLKTWIRAPDKKEEKNFARAEEESEGEDPEDITDMKTIYSRHIRWSRRYLLHRSQEVMEVVGDLLKAFQEHSASSAFPLIQPAIGIGSAFEGWSPCWDGTVYQLLLPIKACLGHVFHEELGNAGETPAKEPRIHVELECTCSREEPGKNFLCFLQHPEEKLGRNRGPSLLESLCTGCYLDAEKTVDWFQSSVMSAWATLPQSRHYQMQLLPSRHSCKLQLKTDSGRTLIIEMLMGVQVADSDIFLCSQDTGAAMRPGAMWAESCAVAEMKSFRHVASQVPHGGCHLRCLYLCNRIVVGTSFSSYAMKNVVMHLLTVTPLSSWSKVDFLSRLDDIMCYLCCCLEKKYLGHFCSGKENMPEGIILPPAFQGTQPSNLFQHLEQDPNALAEALQEFRELQDRLVRMLFYGL